MSSLESSSAPSAPPASGEAPDAPRYEAVVERLAPGELSPEGLAAWLGEQAPAAAFVGPDGSAWAAAGALERWHLPAPTSDRAAAFAPLDALRERLAAAISGPGASDCRAWGAVAFDPQTPAPDHAPETPAASWVLPRRIAILEPGGQARLVSLRRLGGAVLGASSSPDVHLLQNVRGVRNESDPSLPASPAVPDWPEAERPAWDALHAAGLASLERDDLTKIVLALAAPLPLDGATAAGLFAALVRRAPGTRRFLVRLTPGGPAWVGASPETLVALTASAAFADGLAGTRARGRTPEADAAHEAELRASNKEAREHAAVVEALVSALAPFSTKVAAPVAPEVRRFATVMHLHTPVEATLRPGTSWADVVDALQPTPALGGAPKAGALAALKRLESRSRGLYGGLVAEVSPGEARLTVGIRAALVDEAAGLAHVWAGLGVVEGSEAESEWAELVAKSLPLRQALAEARP